MVLSKSWYAVHTRSRHEKFTGKILNSAGIESFLPLVEELSTWKDRKKLIEKPLFPGYLFTRISISEAQEVIKAKGVVRLLGDCKGVPTPIPVQQIENIRSFIKNGFKVDSCPYLKTGQGVKIKNGLLKGAEGILVRKQKKDFFVVSVDILGQSASVEVCSGDVMPL